MKTTGILALALSALTFVSAAPNSKRQFNLEPLSVSEATCCYVFGPNVLIPTKGDGTFISQGKWCFMHVKMDPAFPNDCEKATRTESGGYCNDGVFSVAACK